MIFKLWVKRRGDRVRCIAANQERAVIEEIARFWGIGTRAVIEVANVRTASTSQRVVWRSYGGKPVLKVVGR